MERITLQVTREQLDLILTSLEFYGMAIVHADNDSSVELGPELRAGARPGQRGGHPSQGHQRRARASFLSVNRPD
jgi:hypothetical protein